HLGIFTPRVPLGVISTAIPTSFRALSGARSCRGPARRRIPARLAARTSRGIPEPRSFLRVIAGAIAAERPTAQVGRAYAALTEDRDNLGAMLASVIDGLG